MTDEELEFGAAALALFEEFRNPRADTLTAVLVRSLKYVGTYRGGAREIDERALLFGMIDVGLTDPPGQKGGNAATWLADWLRPRVADLESAGAWGPLSRGPETAVVISAGVEGLLLAAREIARLTVRRDLIDLRHLAVPLLHRLTPRDWSRLRWSPGREDLKAYCDLLLDKLRVSRERGERISDWKLVLDAALGEADGPPPPNLSGFTADRPRSGGGPDPLGVDADVEAFARLIAFSGTGTPLSIGVFGGWGSGKSSFMEQLSERVARVSAAADPAAEGERFLGRIVQIRFNAWHFADANLWVSLTAEFFDQLRAGGYDKQPAAKHAKLVEQVNAHVHDLSTAASATREALSEGEKKLAKAQKARDEVIGAQSADLSQKLVTALAETYAANRDQIGRIVGGDADKGLEALASAAKAAPTWLGRVKVVVEAAARRPVRTAAFLTLCIAGLILFRGPLAQQAVGGLTALTGLVLAFRPGVQLLGMVLSGTAGMIEEVRKAETDTLAKVLKAETELKAAAEEAEARRRKAAEAGAALSRYIDPKSVGNPPRLLRYMLDDNPDTRSLEKEIGLIGRTRRLFEAVDRIVGDRLAEGGDKDAPERIVLYIDDLDRCTYAQVYAVLQAVHLLLAFKLFVVVVGVDVKWVTDALAAQFELRGVEGRDLEALKTRRAVEYLEKIFQLPFWIKPLNHESFGGFVRQLAGPPPAASVEAEIGEFRIETGEVRGHVVVEGDPVQPPPIIEDDPAPEPEADEAALLRTLRLDEAELDFLASPELGAVAATNPRGVLRMINIYRLVRLAPATPSWPLVALFAALETGGAPETAEAFYRALKALPPGQVLDPNGKDKGITPDPMGLPGLFESHEAIRAAFVAAIRLAGGGVKIGDAVAAAQAVRRYSFNRA